MNKHARSCYLPLALTALMLQACSGDSSREAATPSSSSTATPAATPSEATSSGATLPSEGGDWTPIAEESEGMISAGRLGMTANGRPDAPWAVLDVPEGFSTIGGWVIFDEVNGGGVSYWTVSEVVREPCNEFSDTNAIDAGSTVDELVAAFQQQRRTRLTAPVPVTVDGYEGLSMRVRPPADYTFAECGDYNVWESDPAGARHMAVPDEFDRLWILDVEGEVVVLTATDDGTASQASLDDLTDMVESVEFVARS